jgi:hypothetical protein
MGRLSRFLGGIVDGQEIRKSAAYTVVVNDDSGKTFVVNKTVVFTLPAIAVGEVYTFIYDGYDGEGQISISPAAADGITYIGSSTDDKDLINTKATAKRGDKVTIQSMNGDVTAWQVTVARGIWAKEA